MAEVLLQFQTTLASPQGGLYVPRACGRLMDDARRWEGWIEFVPEGAGSVLRTPRETVQPNREDLQYWATGLTVAYLEGALERALNPRPAAPLEAVAAVPAYEGPAPHSAQPLTTATPPLQSPRAVLDPFQVYAQGEEILRQELTALEPLHLRNVILAYGLASADELDLQHLSRGALAELIIAAVRKRAE